VNRQEHLLVIAAKECAEIQHAIAKAMRFGLAVLRMLDVSIFTDGDLVQEKMDKAARNLR